MRRRRNIVVEDGLLETARKVTGEKTYSATITKALEDTVRRHNFQVALAELHAEAAKGDFWDRGYVEQMWPEVAEKLWPRQRRSAHVRRLPGRKGRKR